MIILLFPVWILLIMVKVLSDEDRKQIFEPFFTTDAKGTGLGLYIARELCLANQASLDYKRTPEGLSCFQISFPHSKQDDDVNHEHECYRLDCR
jgi:K+-sensing histidine kinase KdpD